MYLIPIPMSFLSTFGFGNFGMTTLSFVWGEWGKHFTTSFPKISIVLDHAQETTKVFDCFGCVIASIACTFLGCGLMPVLVMIYPSFSVSSAQNFDLGALTFKQASHKLVKTSLKWLRWPSRLALVMHKISSKYVLMNSKAAISSDIFAWEMSGEFAIPIGNLR